MRTGTTLAPLVACLGLFAACAQQEEATARRADARPNIVVFVTDTLRADALEAYGNAEVESPALTALASRGVVYERATTSSPWTRPAIASILSGLYPDVHGVQRRSDALPSDIPLLPELLRAEGYATGAITANPNVGSFFGFDRGFDHYIELYKRRSSGYVRASELVATAAEAVDGALDWIAGVDSPFLLFLLTVDPHVPYVPPRRFDRYAPGYSGEVEGTNRWLRDKQLDDAGKQRLRSLYWGEVSSNDAALEALLAGLRDLGIEDDTIIVFTADHGEEFWEHGGWGHDKTLYNEILHVPLVVADPRAASEHASRRAGSVELVDLLPTLLELAEVEVPDGLDGRPLRRDSGADRSSYAVSANEGRQLRALIRHPWKLVENPGSGQRELFHLEDDPGEEQDLSALMPERTRGLSQALAEIGARNAARADARGSRVPMRPPQTLPADERAALEALGYLESSSGEPGAAGD